MCAARRAQWEDKNSPQAKHLMRKSFVNLPVDFKGTNPQGTQDIWKVGRHVYTTKCPAVAANPELVFGECVVMPGSVSENLVLTELGDSTNNTFEVAAQFCYNANLGVDSATVSDIGHLPHTNVAAVLAFLKERYVKGNVYTMTDPLLVAINPYKDLRNTSGEWIERYRRNPNPERLLPHVFQVARKALENLTNLSKSQTIIVSGESGAGKTQATKQMMTFFASASSDSDNVVQDAVMAANPVLEAFGNAKTVRNDNSSRFGRFMKLIVCCSHGILAGQVCNFLLEKIRVVQQEAGERSYHIFYQFLRGADSNTRSILELLPLNEYRCLKPKIDSPSAYDVTNMNDAKEFKLVEQSLKSIGLQRGDIQSIYSILAGILLLGNVTVAVKPLEGEPNAGVIEGSSLQVLNKACNMLYLDSSRIHTATTTKNTIAGNQEISSPRASGDVEMLLKSLMKGLYSKLFNFVVRALNEKVSTGKSSAGQTGDGVFLEPFMGLLDIFGFEMFETNSLEQLLINTANERLQKHFISVVFQRETKLYKAEGISTATLVWTDNQDIINALCGPKNSVFAFLEDICLGRAGKDEGLVSQLFKMLPSDIIREAKTSRDVRFTIRHTIANIEYCATGFILKNRDVLAAELIDIIQSSVNHVCRSLFADVTVIRGKLDKGLFIASQFQQSFKMLIETIDQTEPHFVRCVKPNDTKSPLLYTPSIVLQQLFSLSILEALQLRNLGFSYRRPFAEFIQQFRYLDLGLTSSKMESCEAVRLLLERSGVKANQWACGKTMLFMTSDTAKLLAHRQREVMAQWKPLVLVLEAMYLKYRLRQELAKTALPAAFRIHAHIKRLLFMKQRPHLHAPPHPTSAPIKNKAKNKKNIKNERKRGVVEKEGDVRVRRKKTIDELQKKERKYRKAKEKTLRSIMPDYTLSTLFSHCEGLARQLFSLPLTEHTVEAIATSLREDLDRRFGRFWHVLVVAGQTVSHSQVKRRKSSLSDIEDDKENEVTMPQDGGYGKNSNGRNQEIKMEFDKDDLKEVCSLVHLQTTHKKDECIVIPKHAVYRDGTSAVFQVVMFKSEKPTLDVVESCREMSKDVHGNAHHCRSKSGSMVVSLTKLDNQQTSNFLKATEYIFRKHADVLPPYCSSSLCTAFLTALEIFREQVCSDLHKFLLGWWGGGAWQVLLLHGQSSFAARLWFKKQTYIRLEININKFGIQIGGKCNKSLPSNTSGTRRTSSTGMNEETQEEEDFLLTLVTFEACT